MLNNPGMVVLYIGITLQGGASIWGCGMISWCNRKHTSVALSTTQVEYIAACLASCEVVWLRKILVGLLDFELETTCVFC